MLYIVCVVLHLNNAFLQAVIVNHVVDFSMIGASDIIK